MIATDHGDPASFQLPDHPFPVSHYPCWIGRRRWWPYGRFLCSIQPCLYAFPVHFFDFNSSSTRYVCDPRCRPKGLFGPIRIRDGNVRLESPFLTSLLDDLARVFLVMAIVLGQPFLWVKDSYSDLVKVRIGRMH